MRKTLLITAAAALGVAGGALAAEFSEVDADANGLVSLEEVQAVAPNITEEEFSSYDGNADGSLNENEFAIWEAASGESEYETQQQQQDQPN